MRNWPVLLFICGVTPALAAGEPSGQTQSSLSDGKIPIAGEASRLPDNIQQSPGNPLPEGISLRTLGGVFTNFAAPDKPLMRGGREIAIFRQAAPAVVLIKTKEGFGSGVVLPDGGVITNRHVVEGIGAVQIFFKPSDTIGNKREAETSSAVVKFVDPGRDLALLQIQTLPPNFKSLKIASRDEYEVGADVYAIGHPLGFTWTFTQGLISGVRTINTNEEHYTAIQTQTPINPGNSGGPLLNSNGEVVGINTWARQTIDKQTVAGQELDITRPTQGLNFAVSARDVREFLGDIANGRISNLALQMPTSPPGCSGQVVFNGRTKTNDAGLKTFSLQCDNRADAWEIFPDDKSKPVEYHLDPERSGKHSIVVFSEPKTDKWAVSLWDFFHDQTFAVTGHHDDGKIRPTRFEFAGS